MPDRLRERAIALYTFLKEFAELRSKVVRTVEAYDEVLWVDEIPRERECYCAAWQAGRAEVETEAWIEIRKPKLVVPPVPPDELRSWLTESEWQNSEIELPKLRDEIALPPLRDGEPARRLTLSEQPAIQTVWERYVEDRWWPWREEDRRGQAVQRIYTDLFRIYQKQQRLGEQYEVVMGFGLLKWELAGGLVVERHLVVTTASVQFDAKRGVVTVGPAADGVKPLLEQDMLEPSERPPVDELRAVEGQLAEVGDAIWDPVQMDAALASWAHSASAMGSYSREGSRSTPTARTPQVLFAPALILRRRTERSFIRAFQEILRQLQAGAPVPDAVARFIEVEEPPPSSDSTGDGQGAARQALETYFPLEANDDQLKIIERVNGHDGVLVQGPPGTGKSHTIVNLICHLLATGQRVLVTSHTARALQVLKRYITTRVPEIAPLAVLLLGEGSDALQAMEDSVQGITQKQNHWDDRDSASEIARAEQNLSEAREEEMRIFRDLRAIREQETFRHVRVFGTYSGSLSEIGERLRMEANTLGWIEDAIPEVCDSPLSDDEFLELLALERRADVRDFDAAGWRAPNADELPSTSEFEELVTREEEAHRSAESARPGSDHPAYGVLRSAPFSAVANLQEGLAHLLLTFDSLARHLQKSWAERAGLEILGGQERVWRELHETTTIHTEAMRTRSGWSDDNPVVGIEGRDLRQLKREAEELRSHLEQGRKLGWGPFRASAVKNSLHIIDGVTIGGRRCRTVDAVKDLVERLSYEERLGVLRDMWALVCVLRGRTVSSQIAELNDLCEPLATALGLSGQVMTLRATVRGIAEFPDPSWHDISALRELAACLRAVTANHAREVVEGEAARLRARIESESVKRNVTPIVQELMKAFDEREVIAYREGLQELAGQRAVKVALANRNELLGRLRAVAPLLVESLSKDASAAVWDDRVNRFNASWCWTRAKRWLSRLSDPHSEEQLHIQMSSARDRIKKRLAETASLRAWQHCFRRMTEHERQHLVAWAKAVRAIGKGTGKYAPLHRANAREHLNECRSAIPAWVMPLYRVAETIQPAFEAFDVVIVDEASQSGPEALLLAYLAKKLIVVGDDKQISQVCVW